MFRMITKFYKCEDGAVTIDWVVLTAFLAFMASVIAIYISAPVQEIDRKTGAALTDVATQLDGRKVTVKFGE